MPRYRIKPGQSHFMMDESQRRGRRLVKKVGGQIITLDADRAKFIMDKLDGPLPEGPRAPEEVALEGSTEDDGPNLVLQRTEDDLYNILDTATGKAVNDIPLAHEDALELLRAAGSEDAG